jgi:hypothetical protein
VICPHCSRDLRYKQRGGRRCSYCRKEFALEPKTNKLGLHDVRVRKLAAKLGDDGRLRYTLPQLWFAAARKQLAVPRSELSGCGCGVVVLGVIAFVVVGGILQYRRDAVVALIVGIAVVVVLANLLLVRARRRMRTNRVITPPVSLDEFRGLVAGTWARVHGGPPPGLVNENRVAAPVVAGPRLALVCPDRAVLACLIVNGVPETYAMALAGSPAHAPPNVPVIVLHDASLAGCRFAADVRAALPGRQVVVAGLRPSTVIAKPTMVRLKQKVIPRGQLAGLGLTAAEVEWFVQGWWSPIAAIPPKRLLAAVAKAAARAGAAADPDRARAERLGFLSWPAA